jgi:anti-anti-sigma regulatory factor
VAIAAEPADVDRPVAEPYTLPATLEVAEVAGTHAALVARLGPGALVIDVSAVASIDVAGIQLLCALVRTASQIGTEIVWRGSSAALADLAALLNLSAELGLPTEPA